MWDIWKVVQAFGGGVGGLDRMDWYVWESTLLVAVYSHDDDDDDDGDSREILLELFVAKTKWWVLR